MKAFVSNYEDVIGAAFFFFSVVSAVAIGCTGGLLIDIWYSAVAHTFRKKLKSKTTSNNDESKSRDQEIYGEQENGRNSRKNNVVVVKTGKDDSKISSLFYKFCSYSFGKSTFGNIELRIGLQMIVNDKFVDADAFEVIQSIISSFDSILLI